MKHFIIDIHYLIPAEQLGEITTEHRAFLKEGYSKGMLLFSGPKIPKDGGVIVARAESKEDLVEIFRDDPYQKTGVATYHFVEFDPVFNQDFLREWVGGEGENSDSMPAGPGPEFIEKTRSKFAIPSQQSQGLPQPPLEIPAHAGLPVINLPAPAGIEVPSIELRKAIEERRSLRHYNEQSLTLEELSMLLWLSQGVKEVTKRPATRRTVPSAGARHAFETYLGINRVEGLPAGLYRYLAIEHQLEEIERDPRFIDRLAEVCWKQQQVQTSVVTFVWAAVRERMYWRYSERGYRYLFLDAGHVCQNLYLAGEALHCGVCALGAFDDDAIDQLLGLNGTAQFVIYAAAVGKKD